MLMNVEAAHVGTVSAGTVSDITGVNVIQDGPVLIVINVSTTSINTTLYYFVSMFQFVSGHVSNLINFLSMKWQWTYGQTLLPWNNHFHTYEACLKPL